VTSGSLTSTDSGTLTVVVGGASKFSVSGYTSPVTAGTASNFTVTAQDAGGNTVTGYIGTVHFTSSDSQSVLPANYTFVSGDSGTHTFSATLKTAGTQSITATDTVTNTITGIQSSITVNATTASQIRVETAANGSGAIVPAQNVAIGSSVTVYSVARDQYGNFVANTAGAWSLASKTGSVVDGDLVPAGDNKSAVFTGHVLGTAAIHVTSGSLTSTDSGTLTVVATPPSGGGGGGGPIGPVTIAGVTNVTSVVNAQGVFNQDVNLWSDDNNFLLHMSPGTTGLTSSGASLTQISIIHMPTPPAFQTGAGMVSLAYDFQPSGATFNPSVTVRFSYDPTLIPAGVLEANLQIAYYDSIQSAWITVPISSIDTSSHFIYAQITHFTPYAVSYGVKIVIPVPTTTTTTTTTVIPIPATTTTQTTTSQVVLTPAVVSTTMTTIPMTTKELTTIPTSSTTTTGTGTGTTTTTQIAPWWLWAIIGVVGLIVGIGIILLQRRTP
jgi:hypothetical protein